MKKIFESDYAGYGESADKIFIYKLDEGEYEGIYEMSHRERCDLMGVFDESGTGVMPGALYHSYSIDLESDAYLIMVETIAYNV